MKLITEHSNEIEYIVEGKNKQQYIKGIFLQSDIKNQNGRVYPFSVLKNQVRKFNKNFVQKDRALGELGHPAGPTVNLDRVSHIITELYEDGKNFIGKAKVIDTPNGKIVKNLLESGVRLGVSSRGLGSVKTNKSGVNEVQNDFVLSTVDIVSDPSAPEAFVNGIMEGKEFSLTGELEYDIRKEINNTLSKRLDKKKIDLFQKFIKNL
tara:strand:+ start:3286 stop:3909 length:624 start_codon:yes stop_codon:yes gene_type:complete